MAERTVRFYEIVNGERERVPNLPFEELRDAVRNLPDEDAYVVINPRTELLGSAYDPPRGRGRVRQVPVIALDRITRDVHLRIERQRNYRPLALADDETLAEPSFFSIFDRNILGVLKNSGSAPGPASFRDYINRLSLFDDDIEVIPLADANALRALRDVEVLTRLNFAVGPDVNAEVFDQPSPLIAGLLRQVRGRVGNVAIEVGIKIDPTGQTEASDVVRQEIEDVVNSDAMTYVDKARIAYRRLEDGRADAYDFINEAVAQATEVDLDTSTDQPTERSAAEALAAAYDDLYDDIVSALNSAS